MNDLNDFNDQAAWIPNIDITGVHEGDVFYNFNDLRRAIGLGTEKRARKEKVLNELYRFVDFIPVGIGYKINRIRQVPFHKKAPKQYQELIQVLLHAHLASTPELSIETTYKQLFYDIAMAGKNYPMIYNEETYNVIRQDLPDAVIPKQIFEEFRRVSSWGLKDKVKSALNYMKQQQLVLWEEGLWICHDKKYEGGLMDKEPQFEHLKATDQERSLYLAARRKILLDMGYKKIGGIYASGKSKEYKSRVDEYLKESYGWEYAYTKLKIWYNYHDMQVSLNDAKIALLEEASENGIEVKREVLNTKIKNMIERRGEAIYNNAQQKLEAYKQGSWGKRPDSLAKYDYMANENALLAWKVLTGYFISNDADISALAAFAPKSNYDDIDDIIEMI